MRHTADREALLAHSLCRGILQKERKEDITMNLTEQLLSRREIYHGRIIDVQVDTVSLPNGNTSGGGTPPRRRGDLGAG